MESEVIMGTKKGQVRKTARRAYEPKKKKRVARVMKKLEWKRDLRTMSFQDYLKKWFD